MKADLALASFFVALFGVLFAASVSMPWQAAVAPVLATGTGLILALVLCIQLVLAGRTENNVSGYGYRVTEIIPIISFGIAVASVTLLGFMIGGTLFVFVYIWVFAKKPIHIAFISAVVVPATIYVIFTLVLKTQIFSGLLLSNQI